MITVTVILKDFTESFYSGLLNMTDADKFATCKRLAFEKRVSMKIGAGQLRDAVELNALMRTTHAIAFKLEPRRGYKLATFTVTKDAS